MCRVMSGVYSLSTKVGITFILPKLDLKKPTKKQLNFSNSIFCSVWKTEQLFIIFFHLSFLKVLHKSVLLSITTCRHSLLTYHTQKYFIKAFYCLAKTWLSPINVTYHSQKRILSLFYYVEFPLDM